MNNQREKRTKLITDLERSQGSKVVTYITGDRHPFGSQIAEDAVRALYDHLTNLVFENKRKLIDLFIYSRGGDVSVPWRIVSMVREFCQEFRVLVPYRAQSAATLLSLGADNIIMGKKGELGPIDPTLARETISEGALPRQQVSVEDVNSFISFIRERANINDQGALAQLVSKLVSEIGSLTLGSVNRQNSHIRLVARKLLTSRGEKMDEEKLNGIIETLTEKIYSHGHGVGRKEAKDIGLHVTFAGDRTGELIWQLYLRYEDFLKLKHPIYPEIELGEQENKKLENLPVAVIESSAKLHVFKVNVDLRKNRKVPPSPQMNINVNLQFPPGIKPDQIPQQAQQILQQLMASISQQVTQIVQQEIVRQSPVMGIEFRVNGGEWYEEK